MTTRLQQLRVVLLVCSCVLHANGLPLSDFFSFGRSAGDSVLPRANGTSSASVQLPEVFRLYGTNYTTAYINANGVVTFQSPSSSSQENYPNNEASIAAFWTPVDLESSMGDEGEVYYRVTNNNDLLLKFTNNVSASFRGSSEFIGFTASQLLIVTWDRVKGIDANKTNTFQCVLATNYLHSYVFFLYADGKMQWAGEPYALVGFNAGDGVRHFTLPTSQSEAVLDLTTTTNSETDVWIFRTDASDIIQPRALIGLNQSSYEVSEADGKVQVCVVLYVGVLARDVEVSVSSRRGGSADYIDFRPETHQITFTSSEVTGESTHQSCIDFQIHTDDTLEIDETFVINLELVDENVPVTVLPHTTLVTVMDDDMVMIEAPSYPQQLMEGEESNILCVNVVGSREVDVSFFYSLSSDTAQEGIDYVASSREFIVHPITSRPCFPVEIIDDDVYRNGRRFNFTIGSHDPHVTISSATGVAEITDNDEERVEVGFEFKNYEVMEGESIEVCMWRTAGFIGQPFTIQVSTRATSTINNNLRAEQGEDFGAVDLSITFHPSEPLRMKKCFNVETYNDSVYEGDELYGLHMTYDYTFTSVNSPAQLKIIDDDVVEVSLSQNTYYIKEGNSLQICANLVGEIENALLFNFDVQSVTAEVNGDLKDINPETIQQNAIIFYPQSNEAPCSSIFVLSDSTLEEELEYFTVALVAAAKDPDPERVHLVNSSALVTIEDIDVVRISFLRSELKLDERPTTETVCVFVQGHSSVGIPVQLLYDGGNATDGADFQLIGGDVTFNAPRNQPAAANCHSLVVRVLDDPVVEDTENLIIRLHSNEPERIQITHVTSAQTMTIYLMDNDNVNVSFVEQLLFVNESAGGVDVCLQMRGFSEASLKAYISTLPQTAQTGIDFDYQSVELTFPPTNQTVLDDVFQLPVAERFAQAPLYVSDPVCNRVEIIDDDILEQTETKLLRLNLTMSSSKVHYESPSSVLITIVDDDVVTLEVQDTEVEVGEENGKVRVCVTMLGRADFPIHAFFTTSSDTAHSPGDFTHQTEAEVVFPALNNSPQCVEIPIVDDNVLEYRESFFARLSVGSQHDDKVQLGNSTLTEITIVDDDFVNVGFEQPDYSVVESEGRVKVCAEMTGALARPVPVSLSTSTSTQTGYAEAGVDYTPLTDVTLFAGLSDLEHRSECVNITIHHDSVLENTETIEVALSSPSDDVRFTTPTTNVYVLDDDGVRMGLMARDYADYEGEEIEICVELVGMFSQDIDLTIQTEQVPGSAQADVDYDSFSLPLVFHPLPVNHQELCHNLTLREDDVFEDEESLSVSMTVSHPRVSIHIERANVVIIDNEEVTISFTSGEMNVSEEVGRVEACVDLQGSTEKEIMYSVHTQALSAQDGVDFSFAPSTFLFTPSTDLTQRHCHSISIVDDVYFESSEDFSVHLSTNVSRVSVVTDLIQVTINDNDAVIIGFNETKYLVAEEKVGGASVYACAVLTGRLAENIVVAMTTRPSSADASDYTSLDELLTFVPTAESQQTICRTVEIHNDRDVEGTEFFTIQLTSDDTRVLLQPNIAEVTISDVDVVCESQVLLSSRGLYTWPQTFPREAAVVRCQQGGVATRFCTITGTWEKPDVSNCQVSAEKLFKYLMLNSFSEENFSELLYAVQLVKIEDKGARSEYMEVVSSYFDQLVEKVENENGFKFTSELFEIALNVSDGIQEWQARVLHPYSSSFVRSTEYLVELFMRRTNATSFQRGLKHSSLFFEKGNLKTVLPTDKPKTIHFSKETDSENYVLVADQSKVANIKSSITLPSSLHLHIANDTNKVGVFFSMYDTGVMFPIAEGNGARRNETNVSSIISATVLDQDILDLKENITFTIFLDTPAENVSGVVCVSWNFDAVNGLGNWTDKGCTNLTDGSRGNVTCSCNHLTNFAVLVDARPKPQGSVPLTVATPFTLNVIAIIGVAVSVLGLLLTIITLLAFKKLRVRDSTVLRIQFCIAVILMLLSFVAGIERVQIFEVCVAISALLHYFTLVSLMWLAAEALLMFQKAIISTNLNYKYFVIVSLVCWLLPIPAVVIPIGFNQDFVTHEEFCFISHNIVFYAAFLGPIAAILIFNLLIFLIVSCVVLRHSARRYKNTQKHSKRKGIMLTMLNIIALLVLFGLTWVFGALMVKGGHEIFEFLFVVSNSLQGFYVFIFFVVLAKETRALWTDTCSCHHKKKEEPDSAHMESIPGTPTVSRVPSLRKKRPQFNVDEYGKRLEELTVDTPDTRKRMNSWDIMYVMPQNQFHVLMFSDQLQQQPEHEQEDDFDKEVDIIPSMPKEGGEESGVDQDNRSTADSGIMDDKPKSTPSPTMGRARYVEMTVPPHSGGTPKHTHSISGIGYVSDDESAEDGASDTPIPVTFKRTESAEDGTSDTPIPVTFKRTESHDIELEGQTSEHTDDVIETSQV